MISVFTILGVISLIYFTICMGCSGFSSSFSFVWLGIAGLCFIAAGAVGYLHKNHITVPMAVKVIGGGIILVGLVLFTYIEVLIVSYSNDMPSGEVDYVIVLGARIDGTRITRSLQMRLDTTIEYVTEYPSVTVIVSGGQGSDEEISEADAMYDYLVEQGVSEDRIIKEDASTNTDQNISYSRQIIQDDDAKVAIVTNSFHLYRAIQIAKKQGLVNVSGIAAPTDHFMAVNYYFREGLAVLKYKLSGQI